ncbi:MAG: DsbA family oxidoreductase [Hyphomicrobiales bacterium]|nr:DsbA family oxidoreductase [Hyphomicrobiales bacterium]
MPNSTPITVAIYSDVICPWCYLGKKRLEEGLKLAGVGDAEIAWLPYELNPDMPEDGVERTAYLDGKFGPGKRAEIEARLTDAARQDNLAFNWPGIKRTPNTRKAHILVALAGGQGQGDAAKGALMKAYFEQGRDIGQDEVLVDIAMAHGLSAAELLAAFKDLALNAEIVRLEAQAQEIGVQGVPFFIVNNRFGVSGAQPAAMWAEALPKMLAERAEAV